MKVLKDIVLGVLIISLFGCSNVSHQDVPPQDVSPQEPSPDSPTPDEVLEDAKRLKGEIKREVCYQLNSAAKRIKSSETKNLIYKELEDLEKFIQFKIKDITEGTLYRTLLPNTMEFLKSKQQVYEEKITSDSVPENLKKVYERLFQEIKEKIATLERIKEDEIDVLVSSLRIFEKTVKDWQEF